MKLRPALPAVPAVPALAALALLAIVAPACGGGDATPASAATDPAATAAPDTAPVDTAPVDTAAADTAPVDTAGADTAPAAVAIDIADFAFGPAEVVVGLGGTVTWTNRDGQQHTATSAGAFDTGAIGAEGAMADVTFDEAGTFSYICSFHPFMSGSVVVIG